MRNTGASPLESFKKSGDQQLQWNDRTVPAIRVSIIRQCVLLRASNPLSIGV